MNGPWSAANGIPTAEKIRKNSEAMGGSDVEPMQVVESDGPEEEKVSVSPPIQHGVVLRKIFSGGDQSFVLVNDSSVVLIL